MISINATLSGSAPQAIAALVTQVRNRRGFNAAIALRGRRELQDHFVRRGGEGNKKGWPSSGFFEARARATSVGPVSDTEASILIRDDGGALARKIRGGGPITPKEKKWLAIPATAEAYAHTPTSFSDLRFVPFGRNSQLAALVRNPQTAVSFGRRRRDGSRAVKRGATTGGEVLYWLKKSTNPPADPRALPPTAALSDALLAAGADYVRQELSRLPR